MAEDDARELGNDGNEHLLYVADDVRKQILVRRRANTDIGNLSKGSQYQYNIARRKHWKAFLAAKGMQPDVEPVFWKDGKLVNDTLESFFLWASTDPFAQKKSAFDNCLKWANAVASAPRPEYIARIRGSEIFRFAIPVIAIAMSSVHNTLDACPELSSTLVYNSGGFITLQVSDGC